MDFYLLIIWKTVFKAVKPTKFFFKNFGLSCLFPKRWVSLVRFSLNIDTHAGFCSFARSYSVFYLDGQASIPRLVDKAMANGMRGIAVTDHGDMFGIKEFFNYVNKKNGGTNGEIKDLKKKIAALESGKEEAENPEAEIAACKEQLEAAKKKLFKPIFGCEMYVARVGWKIRKVSPTRAAITWWCWPRT